MNQGRNGITMIDDLPDLEDLEGVGNYPIQLDRTIMDRPDIQDDKYQKYIRGNRKMLVQSGMERNEPEPNMHMENYGNMPMQPPQQFNPQNMGPSYNCVDVANHVQNCPVCSKFYNNDKTVYILAIVILSIVCLLLLKKVLNV